MTSFLEQSPLPSHPDDASASRGDPVAAVRENRGDPVAAVRENRGGGEAAAETEESSSTFSSWSNFSQVQWIRMFHTFLSFQIAVLLIHRFMRCSASFRITFLLFISTLLLFGIFVILASIVLVGLRLSRALMFVSQEAINTNQASVLMVPLSQTLFGDDDQALARILQDSFGMTQSSSSSQPRDPPNTERLQQLFQVWTSSVISVSPPFNGNGNCMICLQSLTQDPVNDSLTGNVRMNCSCQTTFHKKCLMEWLHFNERVSEQTPSLYLTTCPACRHVFTRPVQ